MMAGRQRKALRSINASSMVTKFGEARILNVANALPGPPWSQAIGQPLDRPSARRDLASRTPTDGWFAHWPSSRIGPPGRHEVPNRRGAMPMPTYITLLHFTQKGIETIKEGPALV